MKLNSKSTMPLYISRVDDDIVSLAHYGFLNGDSMADPEVRFRIASDIIIPLSYQNDYLGVFKRNVSLSFCNTWLTNIKEQQNL